MVGLPHVTNDERAVTTAILQAKNQGMLPLVADIKPYSPRDGNLVRKRDPAEFAQALVGAGACALSVVTESRHFGGSIRMLRQVARSVSVPILRKDFFSSVEQIEESREAGATAVLLILATMSEPVAAVLYRHARELDMEVVVEVHTREELTRALAIHPTIIGINNRDILKLERDSGDVGVTEELAPLVPDDIVKISESSLRTCGEIRRAIEAGADAVLVGTAILQSEDPTAYLAGLIAGVRR